MEQVERGKGTRITTDEEVLNITIPSNPLKNGCHSGFDPMIM